MGISTTLESISSPHVIRSLQRIFRVEVNPIQVPVAGHSFQVLEVGSGGNEVVSLQPVVPKTLIDGHHHFVFGKLVEHGSEQMCSQLSPEPSFPIHHFISHDGVRQGSASCPTTLDMRGEEIEGEGEVLAGDVVSGP
jgi:hypothetical protein